MRILRSLIAVVIACALFAGVAWAQGANTNLGPFVTGVTLNTTVATQIIGSNPSRRGLQICNPNASIILWIAPTAAPGATAVTVAANGAGSYSLPAVSSGTIVCYTFPNGISTSGAGAAWNAITATTPATVTIYEF